METSSDQDWSFVVPVRAAHCTVLWLQPYSLWVQTALFLTYLYRISSAKGAGWYGMAKNMVYTAVYTVYFK